MSSQPTVTTLVIPRYLFWKYILYRWRYTCFLCSSSWFPYVSTCCVMYFSSLISTYVAAIWSLEPSGFCCDSTVAVLLLLFYYYLSIIILSSYYYYLPLLFCMSVFIVYQSFVKLQPEKNMEALQKKRLITRYTSNGISHFTLQRKLAIHDLNLKAVKASFLAGFSYWLIPVLSLTRLFRMRRLYELQQVRHTASNFLLFFIWQAVEEYIEEHDIHLSPAFLHIIQQVLPSPSQ